MEFLAWHYTLGFDYYLRRWTYLFEQVLHYFSLPLLLRTLFSPWKRLIVEYTEQGFDLTKYVEKITFNLISRGIGMVVRIVLFFTGLVLLTLVLIFGTLGLVLWIVLPFLSMSVYSSYKKLPQQYVSELVEKILKYPESNYVEIIFGSKDGQFILDHLGVKLKDLVDNAQLTEGAFKNFQPKNFRQVIERLLQLKTWNADYMRRSGVSEQDFLLLADWFDGVRSDLLSAGSGFSGAGIGLELLFGYTPTLNKFSIDLGSPLAYSHRLIGREQVVHSMERVLNAGNSIVLVGQPGVGKRTVLLEFAHRARRGEFGHRMAYKRVLELDHNMLLSGSIDINQKKSVLSEVLTEAAFAKNIIIAVGDIQRITNASIEGYDFTDVFEKHLSRGDMNIVAVSSPIDYERFIVPNLRLRKFLKQVEVIQPTKEEAMQIMILSAQKWEQKQGTTIMMPALRKLIDESDRFITETPFPEKALELLDAAVLYREQRGGKVVTVDDANAVLAEKTKISYDYLTKENRERLTNLEATIHTRLINQDSAVELIAKTLRSRTVGVKKDNKPIGTFLFMGPTGVGKTETAKVLANVYFGSEREIIRFDMAEYAGREGLERLIGSVRDQQPGAITTAITNKPASLLLLDEFEKANTAINNLFLPLLDEGIITDAFGKKINARNLFVIATSNAGAAYVRDLVGKGVKGADLQKAVVDYVLKNNLLSPELLNRFDGVVVFEPLSSEHLVQIAHLQLVDLAQRLKNQGIRLEVTDDVAQKLAADGYDPAFGARPMRRIVDIDIGDVLGKGVLARQINDGDAIRLTVGSKKNEFGWEKV